jgi:hypothetical protein
MVKVGFSGDKINLPCLHKHLSQRVAAVKRGFNTRSKTPIAARTEAFVRVPEESGSGSFPHERISPAMRRGEVGFLTNTGQNLEKSYEFSGRRVG